MRKVKCILAVIERQRTRQPALERALAFYRLPGREGEAPLRIIAVMPVFDSSWDLTSVLSLDQTAALRRQLIARHEKWLDGYLNYNAMNLPVERRVVWTRNVGKELTALAKKEAADLIIKTAEPHGRLGTRVFTPLDRQLVRHAPVPVLIAQDHLWEPTGVIAVALDAGQPDDPRLRLTNMRLLREAQELSRFTGCAVHLINAIAPVVPAAALDMPGLSSGTLSSSVVSEGCRNVLDFAARHAIPPERCHIREGRLDEVVPALCRELNPTALFIGTSARRGLAVTLIGNICEKVIDGIDCDVAVITPKTVLGRVPTSSKTRV